MSSRFMLGLITAVLLITVFIPGCVIEESNEEKPSDDELLPITVVDDMGDSITISKWPEKIVSLSASATEILYALHLGDKIVGVDSGSDYPSESKNHKVVFDGFTSTLNTEELISLDPDLVILHNLLDNSENARKAIRSNGFNLLVLDPVVIDDVLDNILLMGEVTNRHSEAKTLTDSLGKRIDEVKEAGLAINSTSRPKVLYVIYYDGASNPWVSGKHTLVDDQIGKAGGMNAVSGMDGNFEVNLETIIDEDPDIILTSQSSTWPTVSRSKILEDPVLKTVNAVKNGHVYDIDGDTTDRPGPRSVDGLEEINKIITNMMAGR